MNYSKIIIPTLTLITAFLLTSCDLKTSKVEKAEISVIEAQRDLEIAKNEVEAELKIYRAEAAERIKEFNRDISKIKQKIDVETDKKVKLKLETQLNEYEASLRTLKSEMDNYKASGKENWEDFKDSFSNKMDDLGNSLMNFFTASGTTASKAK